MAFYDNLISLCAEKDVSPSGVAREIGLSNAAANGWKKGKKPSDVTLEKLSQYFGVSVSDLTGEGQKNSPLPDGRELKKLTPDKFKEAYHDMSLSELHAMMADIMQEIQGRNIQ